MSRPTRGVWTAAVAVAVGVIIVSGCGSSGDADQREESDAVPSETGRDRNSDFLVVAQNAADNDPPGDCPLPATDELIDTEEYETTLSEGCLQQYLDFPDSTLHVSSEEYLIPLDAVRAAGLPVLTVDYVTNPANIQFVLETSRALGFVPFVGTRLLDEYVPPR